MKPLWENSNLETTVFPRIIAGVDGRRLFQLLLIGSRALNILFIFPSKSNINHIK